MRRLSRVDPFGTPPERITDCEVEDCESDYCAECAHRIDPEDHKVLWWGPMGWSVCHGCARKAEG